MAVYDDQHPENEIEQLRQITGIGPDEERLIDSAAQSSYASSTSASTLPSGKAPVDAATLARAETNSSSNGFYRQEPGDTTPVSTSAEMLRRGKQGIGTTLQKSIKKHRRRYISGGIITILGSSGLIWIFSILSGPAQFIQIAQFLQQVHFSIQEEQSGIEMLKMAHDIQRTRNGEAYKTRLSFMGNKYADQIETKLRAAGLESRYTAAFGFKEGYVIDRDGPHQKGKSTDEIKRYYRDNYGIEVTGSGNQLFIDKNQLGFVKSRTFVASVLVDMGEGKAITAIQAHVMGERDGITWHPVKKLDGLVLKTVDDWWVNRNTSIKEGAQAANLELEKKPATDKNGKPIPDSQSNADSAQTSAEEVKSQASAAQDEVAKGDTGPLRALQESVHGKLALGGASAAGLLCLVVGIANQADAIKQAQVVLPAVRMGMEAITHGNQNMTGIDSSLAQDSKYSDLLYDKTTNTSWMDAKSIQAEAGKPQNGPDADPTLKSMAKGNVFDPILHDPIISTAVAATCSTVGQGAIMVISFVGGPVSFLTSTAIAAKVGPPIEEAIAKWLAGDALDATSKGAAYGNIINYGARKAADDQRVSAGGRLLSAAEFATLQQTANDVSKHNFMKQSIAYRMFSPYDSRSLFGSFIGSQPSTGAEFSSSIIANILSIPQHFKHLASMITPRAHAADQVNYDYHFDLHGVSADEMDSSITAHPFDGGDAAADLLAGPNGADYKDKALKCFGDTLEQVTVDNVQMWDVQFGSATVNTFDPAYPSYGCDDSSKEWLQIRMFINDTGLMKSYACHNGDNTACQDMGFITSDTVSMSDLTTLTPNMRVTSMA